MSSKIGFVSLGCSKNQIDTEIMLKILADDGYEIVAEDIHADIIIVNTCAFIESAKQEAIDNILDIAWLKENRNLKGIIVCGCLAERYREEVLKELPEADAIVGVFSIHDILDAVKHVEQLPPSTALTPPSAKRGAKKPLRHFVTPPLSGEAFGAISLPPLKGEVPPAGGRGVRA